MRLLVNMAENGLLPDVYGLADAGRWLQRWRIFSWPVRSCGDTVTAGSGLFPIILEVNKND
jgi:hypothetical protein